MFDEKDRVATAVARTVSVLTAGLGALELKRAYCNDCRGKGSDLTREPGKRAGRKCPRCKGAGSIRVGTTKR